MSQWSVVDNASGTEIFVEAELWYEARQRGIVALSQKLGRDVSQDGVHVTEMDPTWRPEPETRTGALAVPVSREPRP